MSIQIVAKPAGTAKLRYPLNYGDIVAVTVDWEEWLGDDDTISSSAWAAETGLTATSTSDTDTTSSATITAGSSVTGNLLVENQVTTASGRVRSVAIRVTVVDLV